MLKNQLNRAYRFAIQRHREQLKSLSGLGPGLYPQPKMIQLNRGKHGGRAKVPMLRKGEPRGPPAEQMR